MKKQIFTITILILTYSQCLTQAPGTAWTKMLGGSLSEDACSIIINAKECFRLTLALVCLSFTNELIQGIVLTNLNQLTVSN